MKIYIFIAFMALFAITNGVFVPPRPDHKKDIVGVPQCTLGPSYWCQNLTAAAGCKAVRHCIQTVWMHEELPPDTTSVCQTCLDMVKQARDQLMSNETQELVKQVFEGSCALLRVKAIVKECDVIADQFIPELIDTLASEMNPQVVCSVAGLCNNERVHRMLQDAGEKITELVRTPNACEGCHTVVSILEDKFAKMSRDEILQSFLENCGELGTFSDSCSNVIVTYFNDIYDHLTENLNSNELCLMAGVCSAQFHQHAKVEITPLSHFGYVPIDAYKEDLPCKLCEQLVNHLRDLLIANTTENEFKMVLTGLCKQTKQFSQECLSLVDEYYSIAYDFLINELNSTAVCAMAGICKKTGFKGQAPYIIPLLPVQTIDSSLPITETTTKPLIRVTITKGTSSVKVLLPSEQQQLPIELLMPPHTQVLYNAEVCIFCEYFLHYLQQAVTDPKTEEKLKEVIDRACTVLPSSVNNTCRDFVNTYEPALVAILAQEIDPSQVCPLIRACPSSENKDVEIFMRAKSDSRCPLCLYAVTKLEEMVKNEKTEANIKADLSKLCVHLPNSLKEECDDFVSTYTDELVHLLLADFNPQEVCVWLKLCTDNRPPSNVHMEVDVDVVNGNVETNMIPDNTVNGKAVGKSEEIITSSPNCVLCEFVMKEIEDQLKDKKTDADIKNVVTDICNIMPRSIKADCNKFVDQYADTVIQLLIQALEPSEICTMMKLCNNQIDTMQVEILNCPICHLVVDAMEKILSNPKIDHDIEHVLEKTCRGLPKQYRNKCASVVDGYGDKLISLLLGDMSKKLICGEVGLCMSTLQQCEIIIQKYGEDIFNLIQLGPHRICRMILLCTDLSTYDVFVGSNPCTYGPSYWCQSEKNADECGTRQHCESTVWLNKRSIPSEHQQKLVGGNRCTWGPSYWCQSDDTADECGQGARAHCESKVWGASRPKRSAQFGADHCTRGPGYWCQNQATADECGVGARQHCETKVWGASRPKRSAQHGAKPCTRGPGYWCQSQATADECGEGARQHCETKVWGANRPKRDAQLGAKPCTRGPGYWCQSQATAEECGDGARQHCETKVWGASRPKRRAQLGAKPCTRGPGYWCQSQATADECGDGARQHCETKVWGANRPKRDAQLGAKPCTRGPGYWCQSQATADECGDGARQHCETKVWGASRPKRRAQLGAKPCTRGPGYWCQSQATADECGDGARQHCETKVWGANRPKRDAQLGAKPCTRGPGYWCQSQATADECGDGARQHCETKVWGASRPKRRAQLGAKPCTRGPGYWCQSKATADECGEGARQHCETKVWGGTRSV